MEELRVCARSHTEVAKSNRKVGLRKRVERALQGAFQMQLINSVVPCRREMRLCSRGEECGGEDELME